MPTTCGIPRRQSVQRSHDTLRWACTDGCSGADLVDGECVASAQTGATYETALLVRNEVETDETVLYLCMLAGMMVLFRFLALVTLIVKAKAR